MTLVLGVDSSTQSCTVQVRDAGTGELLATGRAPHPPTFPPRSEQAPVEWWSALTAAVRAANAPRVSGVGIAGQQHGLVVTDAEGSPLRPAKLWNDTESAPQARRLLQQRPAKDWVELVGSAPVASITLSKVAWLAEHEPGTLSAARRLLLPHDWLVLQASGVAATDRGDASGTGYWSAEGWRPDLLEEVAPRDDWASLLPTVIGPDEAAGHVLPRAADALGARADAVVSAGTGDNMASALGLGVAVGDVVLSLGTSGVVSAVTPHRVRDAGGSVACFADATGRWLPLLCTLNAMKVTDVVARLLGVDVRELDELALRGRSDGLTLLPYLDGERTPDRPEATGELVGLRTDATREQLARAAYEGVVCSLLEGLDTLAATGVDVSGRLLLTGGGARSRAYAQFVADLSGRPVHLMDDPDSVARGACVQAAAVLRGETVEQVSAEWAPTADRVVDPAGPADITDDVRARHRALRDRSG
jgi:xylulokinase